MLAKWIAHRSHAFDMCVLSNGGHTPSADSFLWHWSTSRGAAICLLVVPHKNIKMCVCVCGEWRHESREREREKSENATLRHAARADGKSHLSHLWRKNRMNAIKSHLLDEDARARHVIGISVLMENRERYGRVNLAAMRKMKTVLAQVVVVFYLYGGKSTLDGCDDLSLGSWTTIECSSSVMSGFFGSTIHIARRPGSERLFLLLPLASLPSAEHLQEEHQNRLCDRPKCAPNNLLLG